MARRSTSTASTPATSGPRRHDEHFATIVRVAIEHGKPVRIGVNWGSLDQALLTELMDANARLAGAARRPRRDDRGDGRSPPCARPSWPRRRDWRTTGSSCQRQGLAACRTWSTSTAAWRARCDYPLHLGLTEAGMGMKGIVASTAGLAILLDEGIGDTIRVSLTPEPGGDRTEEVRVAQQVLQSLGLRSFLPQVSRLPRLRAHHQHLLPGDGPADPGLPAPTQMPDWRDALPGRRGDARGGHGLRRQRARRVEARRHRHLAARARSRSRWRPSSWTARCAPRSAARAWSRSSWRSSTTTWSAGTVGARSPSRRDRRATRPPAELVAQLTCADHAVRAWVEPYVRSAPHPATRSAIGLPGPARRDGSDLRRPRRQASLPAYCSAHAHPAGSVGMAGRPAGGACSLCTSCRTAACGAAPQGRDAPPGPCATIGARGGPLASLESVRRRTMPVRPPSQQEVPWPRTVSSPHHAPVGGLPRLVQRRRPEGRAGRLLPGARLHDHPALRVRHLGVDARRAGPPHQGDRPQQRLLPALRAPLAPGEGGRARRGLQPAGGVGHPRRRRGADRVARHPPDQRGHHRRDR